MDNLDVLDRDALILYLQNVRDLEVAMYVIRGDYTKSKNRYYSQVKKLNPTAKIKNHMQKPKQIEKEGAKNSLIGVSFGWLALIGLLALARNNYNSEITALAGLLFIVTIACAIYYFYVDEKNDISLLKWEAYERNIDDTNKKERARADRDMQRKRTLDEEWNKQNQFYSQQYSSAQSLLNSFYSMNIIPVQYRNLPAVCYIYDYLSTSRETLTAALFSQQIDNGIRRIEAKLGEIVDRLEEQIYETRCLRDEAHRYNQRQIEQNTQMLDSLRQTEQNTQRAAQYAELGANYSKANAFFSLATYLKTSR